MTRVLKGVFILMFGLLLAGCPKKPTTVPNANAGDSVAGANTAGAGGAYDGRASAIGKATPAEASQVKVESVILFDYDSSVIKAEYAPIVTAQAKRLAANRSLRLRLEGHTDERGSAEYNIGLGERRAQAVRRAMLLEGASESQLQTVSFGAERPAAEGHNEAAWSQNRRVEIVDASR
jgi:peptidoglycan-associated lipoprotein